MINRVGRRTIFGTLAALASLVVLTAAMVPLRAHISVATAALVLVVPVVIGVVIGGFTAGLISVVSGFLTYFFLFIPPYLTTEVGAVENWTALGVYAVVMVPIARVVDNMVKARRQANERGRRLRQLFEISGLLVTDKPQEELLSSIVTALRDVVDARQVAVLLPHEKRLEIFASAGEPLTEEDRRRFRIPLEQLLDLEVQRAGKDDVLRLALVTAGHPVGLLAITGATISAHQQEPLRLFASQAALAIERAQLREQAINAERRLERGLLPVPLVAPDSPVSVVSRYQPGREHAQLGGDFFDVVRTADGRTWVMVGDVAGHGPEEAVLGVYLRVGWRALVLAGHTPSRVLPALQELLVNERRHDETFATVCMLVLDADADGATAFIAGHPAPLLMSPQQIHELDVDSEPPLGIVADEAWTGQRVEFGTASSLLCFTDGLIEGFDEGPTRLGVGGLIKLIESHPPNQGPDDFVDTLLAEVIARSGGVLADDVALLHLRRTSAQPRF